MKISARYGVLLCFFFCLFILLLSCEKETSEDSSRLPTDSTAVFTLTADDADCSVLKVDGGLWVGVVLGEDVSIKAEVEVLKAGNWKYSTDTINGFFFAGSGSFTETGNKEIILKGSGVPDKPGNYIFSFPRDSTAVFHQLVHVLQRDVEPEAVPAETYFKITFGGVEYEVFNYRGNGPDDVASGYSGIDTFSMSSFVDGGNAVPKGTISLQKQYIYDYTNSTEADVKDFLTVGAYPYLGLRDHPCKDLDFRSDGIIMFFSDENRDGWDTMSGSGNQEGSSFVIADAEDGYDSQGRYYVKTLTRFNCKLYNKTGEMKELIGEMASYFKEGKVR